MYDFLRKINEACETNLIDIQTESYKWSVEEPAEVLEDVSPIKYHQYFEPEFADYSFSDTLNTIRVECKERDATYATSLTVSKIDKQGDS